MGAVPYFRIELIGTAMPSADEPNRTTRMSASMGAEDVHSYTAFVRLAIPHLAADGISDAAFHGPVSCMEEQRKGDEADAGSGRQREVQDRDRRQG